MIVLKKTNPTAGEYPVHGHFVLTPNAHQKIPKTFFMPALKKALAGDNDSTPSVAFETAIAPLAKLASETK